MNETFIRFHQFKPIKFSRRYCSSKDSWKHVTSGEYQVPLSRTPLKLTSGKLARFSDGSCIAQLGGTSVLVASVSAKKAKSSATFMPLTVDYRQKAAAAGRIPTNFVRKELGPTEKEILSSRLIDRSIRALFPKGYNYETQLSCNLLAVDGINDPDVVSINAASASLAVSDIPWNGPIGAVRVGMIDNEVIVNPTRKEISQSIANIVLAATSHSQVVMLEASANNILQQDFMKAIKVGIKETQLIIKGIEELQKQIGKPKRTIEESVTSDLILEIKESTRLIAEAEIKDILTDYSHNKLSRGIAVDEVVTKTVDKLKENFTDVEPHILLEVIANLFKEILKSLVLETGIRCDGRNLTDLRDINCAIDLYSPLHGSALFQRGQTQVFCTVAFDSLESALISDPVSVIMGGIKEKNFMLHYEFPQYATNELGRSGGRRDIGHGALAEKSLRPVVPPDFPFTIRLTSEVLESNGSSSMASVCGGSLALMDAGVPISAAVAGVAIGLISKPNRDKPHELEEYKILTDILGLEDFAGDMDFKLAGSKKGITSAQLDVKIPGLPIRVIMEAIKQATDAKNKILNIMTNVIAKPREIKKPNWPISEEMEIPVHKRSRFFGFGGCNVKKITAETGVRITTIDDGTISIFAPNQDAMDEAREIIKTLLTEDKAPELEFRRIYTADIVEIKETGVMVTLHPSLKPALLHNSQLDQRKIHHPSALGLEIGQQITVQYFGRDPATGNMRLSRKVLQGVPTPSVQNYFSHMKEADEESNSVTQ